MTNRYQLYAIAADPGGTNHHPRQNKQDNPNKKMNTTITPPFSAAIFALASILVLTSASAEITVTSERRTSGLSTNGTFVFNTIPSNTSDDLANGKTFTVLAGSAHAASGPISNLTNGVAQTNFDSVAESFFSVDNAGTAVRIRVDLESRIDIEQINTYSWHRSTSDGTRAPQIYKVYGALSPVNNAPGYGDAAFQDDDALATLGYTLIASVNTLPNGLGGQHGVSIAGTIGHHRYLLFDLAVPLTGPGSAPRATFYGEIDVLGTPVIIRPDNPAPAFGVIVPSGDVELTWTNLTPDTGSDVWVDVWFGTDPGALTQVATGQLNLESFTVVAPVADNYYWRVDSYLDGSPAGTPLTGTVFRFEVIDTDGDGFPDWYELLHTDPPSPTALTPGGDEDLDGITNWEEFQLGTSPSNPDTDNDGLLDGDSITVTSADPRYTEWEAMGIVFTQNGDQRTFRGENEMGTDPLNPDTDGDGLPDGVETNTGVWVSATNTGTDPLNWDTDGDALADGREVTVYGTDPTNPDTDGDGVGDWFEIYASFTDPLDSNDKPAVPYPLPTHDGSPGASDKPVKVYIMSGQSNMLGFGTVSGTGDHTLETMTRRQNKFPNLIDSEGNFIPRLDVRYRGVISGIANGPLAPGFGANSNVFGPELGFGQIMGWFHDEPVLLIKSSIGNRSLGWDVLPPGSVSYVYNGTDYPGYGFPTPTTQGGWYAGKEFDRFFMDESEWAHPDTAAINVVDVLDNFATQYPQWAAQGFEIAGFVWWQGDKDRYDMGLATRYEQNLVRLITALRSYYDNRYPGEGNQFPLGRVAPNAPFVLATLGQTPLNSTNAAEKAILDAKLAVDGESGKYAQFAGNVKTVYAHPLSEGGGSAGHYNGRAGTYLLIGDALGRAMVDLQGGATPPSGGYAAWAAGPFSGTLTDPDPALDFDGGSLATALEWVLGGDPTDPGDDATIAPTLDNDSDPDFFIFTHRRSADAAADANTAIMVEFGSDLAGWTEAVPGADIEINVETNGAASGIDLVEVKIRRTLAAGGKLFARLNVEVTTP